jgi:hypothetical protein
MGSKGWSASHRTVERHELHSRWGGFIGERWLAVMSVFGHIVVSLSWFGVNMLGVGLHSYGFMDRAFGNLMTFIAGQLIIMALGMIPLKHWRASKPGGNNYPRAGQRHY